MTQPIHTPTPRSPDRAEAIRFLIAELSPICDGNHSDDMLLRWLCIFTEKPVRLGQLRAALAALQGIVREQEQPLSVGTRIRFKQTLDKPADEEGPAQIYARAGELGTITGHGTREGYWVKRDAWPAPFGASDKEFEIVQPAPSQPPTPAGEGEGDDDTDDKLKFKPDYAVPPGATISELMRERHLTTEWMAAQLNMRQPDFMALLAGRLKIDEPLASTLAMLIGPSPSFWLNRERQYREKD